MTIEIDDDIYALDLAIQDKIALATMRKRPRIGNGALRKLLGISDSGVRTMIRRFRAKEMLKELHFDGAREFRVKVGNREVGGLTCQNLTKTSTPAIRQKMTEEPPPGSTAEERAQWKSMHFGKTILELVGWSRSLNQPHMFSYYADKFTGLVRQIAADPDLPETDRTVWLQMAQRARNFYAAANHVFLQIPDKQIPAALKIIQGATPEQLAELYERIQNGQLGAGNGPALIEFEADIQKGLESKQTLRRD